MSLPHYDHVSSLSHYDHVYLLSHYVPVLSTLFDCLSDGILTTLLTTHVTTMSIFTSRHVTTLSGLTAYYPVLSSDLLLT